MNAVSIFPASPALQHGSSSWSWILEQQRGVPGTGLTLATSVQSAHTLMSGSKYTTHAAELITPLH